jgi:hypothetical protein
VTCASTALPHTATCGVGRKRATGDQTFDRLVAANKMRMSVAKALFPRAQVGFYSSPTGPGGFASENFTLAMEGYHAAAALGVFDEADFLMPSLYFGWNETSPKCDTWSYSNTTMEAALSIRRSDGAAIPVFANLKFTYGNTWQFWEPDTTHRLIDWLRAPWAVGRVARIVFWFYPDSELKRYHQPPLSDIEAWFRRVKPVPAACLHATPNASRGAPSGIIQAPSASATRSDLPPHVTMGGDGCTVNAAPGADLGALQHTVRRLVARVHGGTAKCSEVRAVLHGVHELQAALLFTAADSGTEAMPVVWSGSAHAVVSGGATVHGWERAASGPTWSAPLRDGVQPHQLWVGGARQTRARAPNAGRFFSIASILGNATLSSGLVLATRLPKLASTADVEAVVFSSYFTQRYGVGGLSNESGGTSLRFPTPIAPPKYATYKPKHGPARSRVYLENAIEFLDSPGEWCVVNSSAGRRLVYYPPPGVQLDDGSAVVSVADELLRISGASHLRFETLSFMHTDHWSDVFPLATPLGGTTDQAGFELDSAALHITNQSHDIALLNCSVAHTAGYGIWVHGGSSRVQVQSCAVLDVGAGGVRLGDGGAGGPAASAQCWHLVLNNSFIQDGGHVTHAGAGVLVHTNAYACSVTHNLVRAFQWSGISVGQVRASASDPPPSTPPRLAHTGAASAGELVQRRGTCGQLQPRDLQQGPRRLADELHQRRGVQRGRRYRHRTGAAVGQWRDLLARDQHCDSPQLHPQRGMLHVWGAGLLRGGGRLQPHLRLQRGAQHRARRDLCQRQSPSHCLTCARCAIPPARPTQGTS